MVRSERTGVERRDDRRRPRERVRRSRAGPWLLSLLLPTVAPTLIPPLPAAGQMIVGIAVDESNGGPVGGAFVTLRNELDERIGGVLTGPDGRFRLPLSGPASGYRLRVERIGYGTAESQTVDVGPDEVVDVRLVMPPRAILLEGLEAMGVRRCRLDPEEGRRVYELWDEARKALEVAAWAEEEGLFRFRAWRYARLHRIGSERVVEERSSLAEYERPPFLSEPAETLVTRGFTRALAGENAYDYFGPDAEALLSDVFLEAYCFGLRQAGRGEPGLVGLAFEPIDVRGVPQITGVLWLDSESRKLSHLEFTYTGHLLELPVPREVYALFGGRVEFRELRNGVWVVDRWSVRMPRYRDWDILDWDTAIPWLARRGIVLYRAEDLAPSARQIIGQLQVKEEGGELAAILSAEGIEYLSAEVAALEGVVRDTIRRAPVEGVAVRLLGTGYEATSDRMGRFRIIAPVEGAFELEASHPGSDTLRVPTDLVRGDVRRIELVIRRAAAGAPDKPLRRERPTERSD